MRESVEVVKCANLFYFANINSIGGVEQFFYYLAKKYKDLDIVVIFKSADFKQLKRLQKYVKTIQFSEQRIKCDKAFFNYNPDIIDYVDANEYIQVIHADYKYRKLLHLTNALNPKMTKFIGVSQSACNSFEETFKRPCELCYNPIALDKPKKVLHLVSATRLTPEKGWDNMLKLASILDNNNITYLWLVFTNTTCPCDNKRIVFMPQSLDIATYINDADFLVQLSTCESYSYSVVESLLCGTPVIVSDLPVYHEIGVNESNGIMLENDFNDFDTSLLYKDYDFEYKALEDNWGEILSNEPSKYEAPNSDFLTVVVLHDFTLKDFDKIENVVRYRPYRNEYGWLYENDTFACSKEMFDYLTDVKKFNMPLVKLVDISW